MEFLRKLSLYVSHENRLSAINFDVFAMRTPVHATYHIYRL